ncbi:MAG: DNA polymerase III subunit delta' [Elusimicrobia bacterium CG_4_10_14_0_8_um_filter_37_32]|nr:MAG: DNA polymerase III subunit delta' [Elusimicrobia bacterium CG_4_10_14_0_8_um_filter_37_32]
MLGQQKAVLSLQAQLRTNRIAQAYLFAGPEGVGRKKTAIEVAKALNCRDKEQIEPCDECPSCRKIDKNIHPDVHLIDFAWQAGLLEEKPEQQTQIKIDVIREIQREISLKRFEGNYKVFIIDQAEKMSQSAMNCLLKTLEEPPENSLLILVTTSQDMLTQTIISRCQIIKFNRLMDSVVHKILTEKFNLSTNLDRITKFANGSVAKASSEDFIEKTEFVNELWSGLKSKEDDTINLLELSKKISHDSEQTKEFINNLLILIEQDLVNESRFSKVAEFILSCKRALRYNVNLNLLTDVLLLKTQEIICR